MTGRWFRDVYRDAVWESPALKAAEKAVAETYARHARDKDGNKSATADLAWLTYERLMEKAGIGRRAGVSAAVTRLVDLGWLKPVQQVSRRATVYRLTIPVGGSSDGGTTDAGEPDKPRSSDGGTTVVPLSESGSSTFPSGSSDGGTQPLGPSKELTTRSISLSAREDEAPASPAVAPQPEREIVEASPESKSKKPTGTTGILLGEGLTPDEAASFAAWADQIPGGPKGDGWYFTTQRNGSLQERIEEWRGTGAVVASCPDCDNTGEIGDWMNRRPCGCLWWKDPSAARKAFVALLKDFPACAHGVDGGDQEAPNGWQYCSTCRGPGWVDPEPPSRVGNQAGGYVAQRSGTDRNQKRSTGVARAEQALTVADNLDRPFGHGRYADQPRASPGAVFGPKGYLHLVDSHSPDRNYDEPF
jgi:hypothetical protein